MSTPKWSALRHQMLREIHACERSRGAAGAFVITSGVLHARHRTLGDAERRALSWARRNKLIARPANLVVYWLTAEGRVVLSRWDAEHPEIAEEEK